MATCEACGAVGHRNVTCRACRQHIRETTPGPHPFLDRLDAANIETIAPAGPEDVLEFMSRLEATPQKTAPVSDELLRGLAVQAFNMAKRDIERDCFNFLVASYHEGEGLHRMAMLEREIVQRLGEDWLNNGRTKTIGFQILRLGVDISPPDAVIIGTAINRFKATAKLRARPVTEQKALLDANHDRHHEAVAEGLLEVCDALFVSVQTPEKMLLYTQDFDRGGARGAPDVQLWAQDEFDGRLKMFGKRRR